MCSGTTFIHSDKVEVQLNHVDVPICIEITQALMCQCYEILTMHLVSRILLQSNILASYPGLTQFFNVATLKNGKA